MSTQEAARTPLYPRVLRLRHVHPNAWQRALLGEGALAVAGVLVLADLATAWTLLALPVAVAVVVKAHDVVAGVLDRTPGTDAHGQHGGASEDRGPDAGAGGKRVADGTEDRSDDEDAIGEGYAVHEGAAVDGGHGTDEEDAVAEDAALADGAVTEEDVAVDGDALGHAGAAVRDAAVDRDSALGREDTVVDENAVTDEDTTGRDDAADEEDPASEEPAPAVEVRPPDARRRLRGIGLGRQRQRS